MERKYLIGCYFKNKTRTACAHVFGNISNSGMAGSFEKLFLIFKEISVLLPTVNALIYMMVTALSKRPKYRINPGFYHQMMDKENVACVYILFSNKKNEIISFLLIGTWGCHFE